MWVQNHTQAGGKAPEDTSLYANIYSHWWGPDQSQII